MAECGWDGWIDGTVTVMLPDGSSDTVSLTGRVDLRTRVEIDADETEIRVYARLENVEGVGTSGAEYRAFGSRHLEVEQPLAPQRQPLAPQEQRLSPPIFPPFTLDFALAPGPPWMQPGEPVIPPEPIPLPITFSLQFDQTGALTGASASVGNVDT